MSDITLWLPEMDLVKHQAIGKAAEEAAELSKILSRILIQGLHETDPKTGKPNIESLADELADLDAATDWLFAVLRLDVDQHNARATRKLRGFEQWQAMLEATLVAPVTSADAYTCPVCAVVINSDDLCASDIELGPCHAECLAGSPVVDLETGEQLPDSKLDTYRFAEINGDEVQP